LAPPDRQGGADLAAATTDDLVAELENRFDALAVVGKKAHCVGRPEPALLHWWARGDKHACLGLVWHLEAQVKACILRASRDSRPGDPGG